jgi:hypothetical protein
LARAAACYDSDYPIVRIRDGTVTGRHNEIKGPRALAMAESYVALFGGHRPDHDLHCQAVVTHRPTAGSRYARKVAERGAQGPRVIKVSSPLPAALAQAASDELARAAAEWSRRNSTAPLPRT